MLKCINVGLIEVDPLAATLQGCQKLNALQIILVLTGTDSALNTFVLLVLFFKCDVNVICTNI